MQNNKTIKEFDEEIVSLEDTIIQIAVKQLAVAVRFKQPRLEEIQKHEDDYLNKKTKRLKGRFNVPLPIISGYIDTLMAKIDDKPILQFINTDEADLKKVKKIGAAWEYESGQSKSNWAKVDRSVKKQAIMSGRGIYKVFAESDPKYKSYLEVIDYLDFYNEPQGGGDNENHLFCGQMNIFKSDSDLKEDIYNQKQVAKLKLAVDDEAIKKNDEIFKNKVNRFNALGIDITTNSYVGQKVYSLTEHYLEYKGTRYYVLFDYSTGIWVRFEKLKDIKKDNLYPYVSFATHYDPFMFWSKSALDDIRPISEAMKIVFNQSLDNIQKRNWSKRAVDVKMFPNLEEITDTAPNGLVQADTDGKAISQGVYQFETPDNTNITIRLMDYCDNLIGTKLGVSSATQGVGEEDKVGIYYGNLQQTADRLGLLNKNYSDSWTELGIRYVFGLKEHLNEKMAIKMIGNQGIEWDNIIKEDLKTDKEIEINVMGGSAEFAQNDVKNKKRAEGIGLILSSEILISKINPDWIIEQILRNSEFEEQDIKKATNIKDYGNEEILSEAAIAIQEIIIGKEMPKINRGANMAFIQKIVDFANDNDIKENIFMNLMDYANSHFEIAQKNLERSLDMPYNAPPAENNPMGGGMAEKPPNAPLASPTPNTERGTASKSAMLSQLKQSI